MTRRVLTLSTLLSLAAGAASVQAPTPLTLSEAHPGVWRSTIEANELGLWRATDGTLNALANVGPANPREFAK